MYRERASRLPGAVVWRWPGSPGAPVLPDGCTDLLFDGARLLIAGPDTVAFDAGSAPGPCVGLRMSSGAGPALWGVPGNEIVNQRVPLSDIWQTSLVDRLTEQVGASDDPGVELERIVAARWRLAPPDPAMMDIAAALGQGSTVAAVASRLAFSERQLHRRSLRAFGYGAKTLSRILRMSRALERARAGGAFAQIAHDCGYADQAHLARDVREFTGRTLTELLAG